MNEIILPDHAGIITPIGVGGTFAVLASPARPTFDALHEMLPAFRRLDRLDLRHLDVKEAKKCRETAWDRLSWLPGSCALDRANILFDAAKCQSAPAEWLLAMVNHMLAERPNARNVSEDYAAGIVDSMLYDEELHGDYERGLSAPVLVAVVRELRRTGGDFVPSPAVFLNACVQHRKKFAASRARFGAAAQSQRQC